MITKRSSLRSSRSTIQDQGWRARCRASIRFRISWTSPICAASTEPAGASDQVMREIIADGFKEIYFQDSGARAMGLSDVAVNDIDYLDFDF